MKTGIAMVDGAADQLVGQTVAALNQTPGSDDGVVVSISEAARSGGGLAEPLLDARQGYLSLAANVRVAQISDEVFESLLDSVAPRDQ